MPEYEPNLNFSKIEILLKTIIYIENLREKLRDLLQKQDASILSKKTIFYFLGDTFKINLIKNKIFKSLLETQEELEESLKALVSRNNCLVQLLEKCNVKAPPFIGPKLLSYIVTIHDDIRQCDEEVNKISKSINKSISKPKNKNCNNNNNVSVSPNKNLKLVKDVAKRKSSLLNGQKKSDSDNKLPNISLAIPEIQKIGSVEIIPVSKSSNSEIKPHDQPIKNSVQITPLLAIADNDATQKETCDNTHSNEGKNNEGLLYCFIIVQIYFF